MKSRDSNLCFMLHWEVEIIQQLLLISDFLVVLPIIYSINGVFLERQVLER